MRDFFRYYLTTQNDNRIVDEDLFFNVLDVLNCLHIAYVRTMQSNFLQDGEDYDRITCVYLQTDFNMLFEIIKYYNDEKG